MIRKVKYFCKDTDGATALEFAILAPVFFSMMFASIEVGYQSLIQSELDALSYSFTMNMAISEDNEMDKTDVVETLICSQEILFLSCEDITVGVDAFDRYTFFDDKVYSSFIDSWKTGCGGATIVTELNYPTKSFVLPFVFGDIIRKNDETYHRARGLIKRELTIIGNGQASRGLASSSVPCT